MNINPFVIIWRAVGVQLSEKPLRVLTRIKNYCWHVLLYFPRSPNDDGDLLKCIMRGFFWPLFIAATNTWHLMRNVNHSCNIEALDSLLRKDVIAQKLVWPSPLSRICFVVRGLRCRIFWCWLNGIPLEKLAYKCKQKNAGSVNLHKLGWCLHNQWFLIKWKCCQLTLMNLSTKVSHISKIS